MKLYTKKGDAGNTSLLDGSIIKKSDLHVEAYGQVDELNSCLGYLIDLIEDRGGLDVTNGLKLIQEELFLIGSELAAGNTRIKLTKVEAAAIARLEQQIDTMDQTLPPLTNFILPRGDCLISWSHVCRSICRRAERAVVQLSLGFELRPEVCSYLNRLSDFLFCLARYIAHQRQIPEVMWRT